MVETYLQLRDAYKNKKEKYPPFVSFSWITFYAYNWIWGKWMTNEAYEKVY